VGCLRRKLTIDRDKHQCESHGLQSDEQRFDRGIDNRDTFFTRDGLTNCDDRGISDTCKNAQKDGHKEHQKQNRPTTLTCNTPSPDHRFVDTTTNILRDDSGQYCKATRKIQAG